MFENNREKRKMKKDEESVQVCFGAHDAQTWLMQMGHRICGSITWGDSSGDEVVILPSTRVSPGRIGFSLSVDERH